MRWLFALLLVANAALLMWGRWYREPLVAPPPAPPPEVAEEKIRRLEEPGVRLTLSARGESDSAPPAPAPIARCYRLGPFASPETAANAGARLRARGLDYERIAEARSGPAVYHVYLPPLSSRAAAERMRRRLTRLGFDDHALIVDEGLENAVSLGVFAVEDNARARMAQLARRGVEARLRTMSEAATVYWLALSPPAGDAAALEALRGRDWEAPDAGLRPAPCS